MSLHQAVNAVGQENVTDTPKDNQGWQMLATQLTPHNNMIMIASDVFDSWSIAQVDGIRVSYESVTGVEGEFVRDGSVVVLLAPIPWLCTQNLVYPGEKAVGHPIPIRMSTWASQPTSIQLQPEMISQTPPNSTLSSAAVGLMAAMEPKSSANEQKIPRPPNAFILYRKAKHVPTVAKHPNVHNNEISAIIGRMWAKETDEVKGFYKDLAEQKKKEHYANHPDYVYRPRKPSEKKRRMTKKKAALALMQAEANSITQNTTLLDAGAVHEAHAELAVGTTKMSEPTAAFQAASSWAEDSPSVVYRFDGHLATQLPLSTGAKTAVFRHNDTVVETDKTTIFSQDAAVLDTQVHEYPQQLSSQFAPSAETLLANVADELALAEAYQAGFFQDRDLADIFHPEEPICRAAAEFEAWLNS